MRELTLIAILGALAACGGGSTGGNSTGSPNTSGGLSGSSSGGNPSGSSSTSGSTGPVAAPQPTPAPGVFNNDFKLALTSATPGATICFTLDGSTPACSGGVCQGSAATYSAQTQVPIDGSVTNTAPGTGYGSVTLNALACRAGQADGAGAPATFTLQVAEPTLTNPTTANALLYSNGEISPTVASATLGATAFYTIGQSSPPTCTSGTALSTLPAQIAFSGSQGTPSLFIVGCKQGYAPSAVAEQTYDFLLNPPSISPPSSITYDANTQIQVDDSANAGAGDVVCFTSDGTLPACGCAATGQRTGGAISTLSVVNRTGTSYQAIACPPAGSIFNPSDVDISGAYTLQLDPISFVPVSGTAIPYLSASLVVTIGQSGDGAGEPYDYICWSQGGAVPDCNCATDTQVTQTAGNIAVAEVAPPVTTLQAIGCLLSDQPDSYLPSNSPPASATYSVQQMATPSINPGDGTIASNPQQVTFTNNDTVEAAYFCYTTDGSAPSACPAAGMDNCTTNLTAASATSTDGPTVSVSGTEVRVIACDIASAKSPSAEPTPVTFE